MRFAITLLAAIALSKHAEGQVQACRPVLTSAGCSQRISSPAAALGMFASISYFCAAMAVVSRV
jgi:hypothetical protein